MKFNGIDSSAFPCLKVKSFRQSYYSDFERHELTQNGILLAAIEVPTIRKIEVDLLIRWKLVDGAEEAIRSVTAWLLDGGTSQLYPKDGSSYYFIARCTSVSMPQFNGRSATCIATFHCDDYRAYDASTQLPIIDDDSQLTNFTFAGKHCLNDMGCLFLMDNQTVTPAVRTTSYAISGISGSIRYDSRPLQLNERSIAGTLYLVSNGKQDGRMSDQAIADRLHRIATWLAYSKRSSLVLDSDPSRRYLAEVTTETTLDREKWANGAIGLKFTCQPYAENIRESKHVESSVALTPGSITWIALPSSFTQVGFTTPLNVEIKNNWTDPLTSIHVHYVDERDQVRSVVIGGGHMSLAPGATLYVDSSKSYLHDGTNNLMKTMLAGDFPSISPNARKLVGISSDVHAAIDVTVRCNVRWL